MKNNNEQLTNQLKEKAEDLVIRNESLEGVERLNARNWRCVDGRISKADRYAAPGGALGFQFAIAAAVEQIVGRENLTEAMAQAVLGAVEDELGGMTSHTDEHAQHENRDGVADGCGHCSGALKEAGQYGLTAFSPHLQKYLDDLKKKEGYVAEVLPGEHSELGAILVAKDAKVTLPATNGDSSFFICHWEDFLETLDEIAPAVLKAMQTQDPVNLSSLNLTTLQEQIKDEAEKQLNLTLARLNKNEETGKQNPIFKLNRSENNSLNLAIAS